MGSQRGRPAQHMDASRVAVALVVRFSTVASVLCLSALGKNAILHLGCASRNEDDVDGEHLC